MIKLIVIFNVFYLKGAFGLLTDICFDKLKQKARFSSTVKIGHIFELSFPQGETKGDIVEMIANENSSDSIMNHYLDYSDNAGDALQWNCEKTS